MRRIITALALAVSFCATANAQDDTNSFPNTVNLTGVDYGVYITVEGEPFASAIR